MKTLPIQLLFQTLQKFDRTVTLKPGQVFSGKVLNLFPGNLAEIQLAGTRLSAKLDTGLSVDKQYYFQVQPDQANGIPLLKVLGEKGSTSAMKILGADNQSPAIRTLLTELADQQVPITKEMIAKAGQWLKDSPSIDRGIQALKMMMVKNFPQTETVYRALYHVQETEPLVDELTALQKSIQSLTDHTGNKSLQDVQKGIQRILTVPEQQRTLDGVKQLLQTAIDPDQSPTLKADAMNLLQRMKLIHSESQLSSISANVSEGEKLTDRKLVQLLNLNKSVQKAESQLQMKLSRLSTEQWNSFTILTGQQGDPSPKLNLLSLLRGLGLTAESDLVHQQLQEMNKNGQLKITLMEALDADLPTSMRDKTESLVHRLTGHQLLHSSDHPSFTSLFYQIPFQFHGWKSDILMKWETKKESNGTIDEDYSRILFYLDLQHLKETVIDMNVQNRIITLKIINDSEVVQPIIHSLKDGLKTKLEALDYTLSSIKLEKPAGDLQRSMYQPIDPTRQGVDLTV